MRRRGRVSRYTGRASLRRGPRGGGLLCGSRAAGLRSGRLSGRDGLEPGPAVLSATGLAVLSATGRVVLSAAGRACRVSVTAAGRCSVLFCGTGLVVSVVVVVRVSVVFGGMLSAFTL